MSDSKESLSVFLHWFSWAISIVASLFFIFFLATEGIPDVLKGKDSHLFPYLPFLCAAITGCCLSLFKRKAGAVTMIVAGLGIEIVLYLQGGRANFGMMVVYGLPYIFPGLLLLVKK